MKFASTVLSGAVAAAVAQLAFAQGAVNIHPKTGDVSVEQSGVQNSQQIGEGNPSSQVHGNQNQQRQQYGSDDDRDRASSGATAGEEDRAKNPGNQGWHKGRAKNKHRDESSGKYNGEESPER